MDWFLYDKHLRHERVNVPLRKEVNTVTLLDKKEGAAISLMAKTLSLERS